VEPESRIALPTSDRNSAESDEPRRAVACITSTGNKWWYVITGESRSTTSSRPSSPLVASTTSVTFSIPSQRVASRRMSLPSMPSVTPRRSSAVSKLAFGSNRAASFPRIRNRRTKSRPGSSSSSRAVAPSGAAGQARIASGARSRRSSGPFSTSSAASLQAASSRSSVPAGQRLRSSSMLARKTAPCAAFQSASPAFSLAWSNSMRPLRFVSASRSTGSAFCPGSSSLEQAMDKSARRASPAKGSRHAATKQQPKSLATILEQK